MRSSGGRAVSPASGVPVRRGAANCLAVRHTMLSCGSGGTVGGVSAVAQRMRIKMSSWPLRSITLGLQFYATYGGQSARAGREQLLADLDVAFKANTQRAAEKTRVLKDALRILSVGLFVAGALIVFATPSKVDSHVCSHPASAAPCSAATGAGPSTIRSAAGRPARGYRITPPEVH